MDTRTAALQLAAEKRAEITKELTVELHIEAFTSAIASIGLSGPKIDIGEFYRFICVSAL